MLIDDLLQMAAEQRASDLHLISNQPPWLRIDNELRPLAINPISAEECHAMLWAKLPADQRAALAKKIEIDFASTVHQIRFRANVYYQQQGLAAAFRLLPQITPSFASLQLPTIFPSLCQHTQGLILITGATGSGKSTTLAATINHLNHTQAKHIITIEDPIEFIYSNQHCLITQREVNRETQSFQLALRAALRQDPDIILIGELRDLETIRLALTAAETGHLVFATLHTASAAKTLARIVDVFPGNEKDAIRTMLAESLVAVISQQLLPRSPAGRIGAFEILICTPAIRNLIRENKTSQIYSAMQTGHASGMCTMEQYIARL